MKTPTELWRCEECYGVLEDEDASVQCYIDTDVDPDAPPMPSPAELEAAGQQRLFG